MEQLRVLGTDRYLQAVKEHGPMAEVDLLLQARPDQVDRARSRCAMKGWIAKDEDGILDLTPAGWARLAEREQEDLRHKRRLERNPYEPTGRRRRR